MFLLLQHYSSWTPYLYSVQSLLNYLDLLLIKQPNNPYPLNWLETVLANDVGHSLRGLTKLVGYLTRR